jgi:hypothetical protein
MMKEMMGMKTQKITIENNNSRGSRSNIVWVVVENQIYMIRWCFMIPRK